jgi:hypothetical protein
MRGAEMKTNCRNSPVAMGLALAAGVYLAVLVEGSDRQREFGPEWTKVDGRYERKVEVTVSHSLGGNVSGYAIPLENGRVYVHEIDGGRGFTLGSESHGYLTVDKTAAGKTLAMVVRLGDVHYYDLDADGMVDAIIDGRGGKRKPMVVVDDTWVVVEDSKTLFSVQGGGAVEDVWAVGRATRYSFRDGKWTATK